MGWTSVTVTQSANTEVCWTISGGALTNHDAVVTKLVSVTASPTRIGITRLQQSIGPNQYHVCVRATGPGAVAYQFAAETMD
jgi:hypothetical protein